MYNKHFSRNNTPQNQKAAAGQAKNNAGGYSFKVDNWTQLDRFLILGAEGGTFYVTENKLVRDNAKAVLKSLEFDGKRTVDRIVQISKEGRAFKQEPALFALALAASDGDDETRRYALARLNEVARTGTHLFKFAEYVSSQRGWGRALKRAIANWYMDKDIGKLAYQIIKYGQREGWSHRDLLRLSHPKTEDKAMNSLFKYVVSGEIPQTKAKALPDVVYAHENVRNPETTADYVIQNINAYGLPHESIPSEFKNDVKVNKALLAKMPYMATIRNLGRLTANGTIKPLSEESKMVVSRILDEEQIKKSRVHPMHLYLAYKTYHSGRGLRGGLSWSPVPQIVDALQKAFYKAFNYVETTGKNFYLGVDVSGSMTWSRCAGAENVTPAEGAKALALTIAKTEPNYYIKGFCGEMVDLGITADSTLESAYKSTYFGPTDCSLPMRDALDKGYFVDTFVVLTDSETWVGNQHSHEALQEYRRKVNPNAKLIVIGMVANRFTIADPNDAGMLDIAGFDANIPALISEFSK